MGREKLECFELHYRRYVSAGGTLPTARMMAELAGVSVKYARYAMRCLGLDYRRLRNGRQADRIAQDKAVMDNRSAWTLHNLDGKCKKPALRQRVLEIQRCGDAQKRPERLQRPGEGDAACRMLTCPVCGSMKLIAPRMHPYWVRNAEGTVIFVCGPSCMGQDYGRIGSWA